jgi:hypothetical protein
MGSEMLKLRDIVDEFSTFFVISLILYGADLLEGAIIMLIFFKKSDIEEILKLNFNISDFDELP